MHNPFFNHYSKHILLVALLGLPGILFGVIGAAGTIDNDVRQWLPASFDETREYNEFVARFERDDVVVVSWPGCTLKDERLDTFAKQLLAKHEQFFARVVTGSSLLRQLIQESGMSAVEAGPKLQGILIGPDSKTTAAICVLQSAGAADRSSAVEAIRETTRALGIADADLRLGGPTMDQLALEQESRRSLYQYVAISAAVAATVAWLCLGYFRLTIMVFSVALYGACASLALVYYSGGQLNLIMIVMPVLIYVLGLSGSVHLVNYYRDAMAEGVGPIAAPWGALRRGWSPCCLASLTTALGLVSLLISQVQPIRDFGFYSALGLLGSLAVLLLGLPALLQTWPPDLSKDQRKRYGSPAIFDFGKQLVHLLVFEHSTRTVLTLTAVMIVCGLALSDLQTTVKLQGRFSPRTRVIQDYAWLEQNVSPLVPMEILLRFPADDPTTRLERVQLLANISAQLKEIDEVGGALSAATATPDIPTGSAFRDVVARSGIKRFLDTSTDRLHASKLLYTDDHGAETWRISARVEALNSLDYGSFVNELQEIVRPLLPTDSGQSIDVVYTGIIPLVYKAQRQLFKDLFESFMTAFLVISAVILFIFRSLAFAVISMIPNLFPAVVIFGLLSWVQFKVDLGTMVTASVALGIAVDDTLHFLTWFRRGGEKGQTRAEAIRYAYRNCAKAMIQTTLICGLGLLVFRLSAYNPTRNFSMMMMLLLLAALVGDLLFLPALLHGPLGRWMVGKAKTP